MLHNSCHAILALKGVTFSAKAWWTDWPSDLLRGIDCYHPSEYETTIQMLLHPVAPERRASDMLTISELIAVLSVCLASFSLGYKLGRDKSLKDTKNEQE